MTWITKYKPSRKSKTFLRLRVKILRLLKASKTVFKYKTIYDFLRLRKNPVNRQAGRNERWIQTYLLILHLKQLGLQHPVFLFLFKLTQSVLEIGHLRNTWDILQGNSYQRFPTLGNPSLTRFWCLSVYKMRSNSAVVSHVNWICMALS